jgi:putative drug exporter of the RND superfamily
MNSSGGATTAASRNRPAGDPGGASPGGATSFGALGRLAGWSYDRRWRVLVGWAVLLVVAIAVSQLAGTHFQDKFSAGNTPSQRAEEILQSRFPGQAGDAAQVVFDTTAPTDAPANQVAIADLAAQLRRLPHVASVTAPVGAAGRAQVSRDGHIAYATVQFDEQTDVLPKVAVQRVVDTAEAARHAGFDVQLGGTPIGLVVTAAPGPSEGIGVTAAMLIMLIAFGSVVAMGLPIVTALFGLLVGVSVLELLTHVLVVPTFSPEMAVMIGLGVGIDYALFVVTRFRQELAAGRSPRPAVVVTLATAGRAVLFAGSTVVISLLGLFLIGQPYMIGVATASIVAVLFVMLSALTLLPALLGFAGTAIDRLRVPFVRGGGLPTDRGFWFRWSRTVQRRAWLTGTAAVVVLVALALPMFSMRLAFTDAGNNPTSLTTRQAYDLLAEGFGPGFNGPLVVAVAMDGPASVPVVDRLATALRSTPGIATVAPPRFDGTDRAAVVVAVPTTSPQSAATQQLVGRLRTDVIPRVVDGTGVVAEVGGETAASVDAAAFLSGRMYWVVGAVIVLAVLLLMAVFRSVVIPLKAAVMNLLSVGAAYGVIVAVFQWGWLGGVFGIGHTGPIDPWIPITMFTILFGLSMDYEVFLLSRIREEWLRTGDSSLAVADGLAGTARVITAAAAVMVLVFASFVVNDPLHVLKVFGFGMAVAVLVDATVVRMVLVPSVMELLGGVNWWMPRWLDRVVPHVGTEVDPTTLRP